MTSRRAKLRGMLIPPLFVSVPGRRGRIKNFRKGPPAAMTANVGETIHRMVCGSQSAICGKIISSTVVTTIAIIRTLVPL